MINDPMLTPPQSDVATTTEPNGCPDCGFVSCVCFDYDEREIGCVDCDSGWRHGCCDDLCYGSNEPEWCDNAIACCHCNPHGEVL
jgi:hypothetical protein